MKAAQRGRAVEIQRPLISVVVCAHDEEKYVDRCLPALTRALKGLSAEVIFVADRCTDNTVGKAENYRVRIIEKRWRRWRYGYAESLQTGYLRARGRYLGIVDVDIVVPPDLFKRLVPSLKGNVASVAADVVTYPNTLWNRAMYAWERTYDIAPLGREPYGATRIVLKKAMDEIDGFRDVPTPDTDIDIRLSRRGYRSVAMGTLKVYHMRRVSLKTTIDGQINRGRGRYTLGLSLFRTVGHALFRLRPFAIQGWIMEWQSNLHQKQD